MKIVALVPMRHHSQRVPGKNYRPLAGRPLFHYIIETLLAVPEVTEVVVDTDSPQVVDGLRQHFPGVCILERPERLRADDVPMNEILLHDASQVEADYYVQTHSTNPLLRPETLSQAIGALLSQAPRFDSLFAVTLLKTRLWDQLGRPINHNPNVLLQTQDLPPVYLENSCIYMFQSETLARRYNRLGERPLMFPIDASQAWDIDDELDFQIAEFLMQRRLSGAQE